jgi:membrane-associated protease RseP (regulator of RpoE activity)
LERGKEMKSKRRVLLLLVALLVISGLLVGGAVTAAYAYQALAGRAKVEITAAGLAAFQDDGEGEVEEQEEEVPLSEQGVLITHVEAGSPAAEAGLQRGSIILAVDGEAVDNPAELHEAIFAHEAGDTITLTTLVCDAPSDIEVTLASAGPYLGVGIDGPFGGAGGHGSIEIAPMPFGAMPGEGFGPGAGPHFFPGPGFGPNVVFPAIVMEVVDGSPAAEAGLQPGDFITTIDGEAVDTAEKVTALIGSKAPGDTVEVTVERNGETVSLTVTLAEHPEHAERGYLGIRLGHTVQEFQIEPAPVPGTQS